MKHLHVVGHGVPLVLVPGIQGRWEYMRPAIDALSASFRVMTFPLSGERASGRAFDPAMGLDNYVSQVDAVLDECQVERAVICGISFGGLVALHYAASRPDRSAALVLASTPGPHFRLRERHRLYTRAPWLFGPAFLLELPRRVRKELARAIPDRWSRAKFFVRQVATFVDAPISVSKLAQRSAFLGDERLFDDCRRIAVPTLVVTGEPALDYVVPVEGTSEYARLIAGAQSVQIERSGHIGYITRPAVFAGAVREFLATSSDGQRFEGLRRGARHDAA